MVPWSLWLAVALGQVPSAPDAKSIIERADAAVVGDSVRVVAVRWDARLRRDSSAIIEEGNGYEAALVNFRFLANTVWTTDETVRALTAATAPAA